ncbi:MAG TPA: LegC family aminotransferase [Candidatus Sulfotelmatobacter sp.]
MKPNTATAYIPLSAPEIRGNEWKYVKDCLDTGWVSSVGEYVNRFESMLAETMLAETMIAETVGAQSAVATSNGTSALHIALLVSGVQPDDEVLVSTLTFIAPVNAIRYAGAWPVLIDAEPQYWQLDAQKTQDFLRQNCQYSQGERELRNRRTGRRIKAILPVHILGHPVDMEPIVSVAHEFGLTVIEDATECLGAKYRGRNTGTIGDIACFSFNGNKIITTGGGGAIVTSNADWAAKAKYLTTQAKDDPVEFVHGEIGYNYRLTNIQAAMGCGQIEMLPEFIRKKQAIASCYAEGLKNTPGITLMPQAEWAESIFWLYTVLIDEDLFGLSSRNTMRELEARGIQTRPLWQPMHRSPVHRDCEAFHCEAADWIHARALSLPCSVGLSDSDQAYVIESLMNLNRRAIGR